MLRNTEDEAAISTRTNNNFQLADGSSSGTTTFATSSASSRESDSRPPRDRRTTRGRHFGCSTSDLLDGLAFDWYVSDATADTDIPNEIKFSAEDHVDPATGEVLQTAIRRSNSAADYRFTDLEDEVHSSGWDLMKPFTFEHVDVEISGGQDVSREGAQLHANAVRLGHDGAAAAPILVGTPGHVFTDDNILNPVNGFELSAGGIGTESYLAAQTTDAAYLKADASSTSSGASPAGYAGRTSGRRRCRSTRSNTT